jgi:hypothetical protein
MGLQKHHLESISTSLYIFARVLLYDAGAFSGKQSFVQHSNPRLKNIP